jgi:hypothetical protein
MQQPRDQRKQRPDPTQHQHAPSQQRLDLLQQPQTDRTL